MSIRSSLLDLPMAGNTGSRHACVYTVKLHVLLKEDITLQAIYQCQPGCLSPLFSTGTYSAKPAKAKPFSAIVIVATQPDP